MHPAFTDKLPGYALRALALGLLLLALVLWTLRLALPALVPDYRATLELRLAEELDQPVAVEALRLDWQGWRPVLYADGVEVGPDDQALGFQALRVELAPVASLVHWQPVVRDLALVGLRLEAGLDERGRPVVRGLEGLTLAEEPFDLERLADFDWSLLPAGMRLEDAEVLWHGADGRLWRLPGVARLERDARRLRAAVTLEPPEALGGGLQGRLELDLSGRGTLPGGRFHLEGRRLVLDALPGLLPSPETAYRLYGDADLTLWGEWTGGAGSVTGDFQLLDLEWRREADAEVQLLAHRLAGQARWSGTPAGWRVDVNDLVMARPDQDWAAQDAAFSHRRTAEGVLALGAVFDRAHLDDLVRLAELSPGMDRDWMQRLHSAAPYGELRDAHLRLRLGPEGDLQRLDSAARFHGVGMAPVGPVPGIGPLDGHFRTTEEGGQGAVSAHGAALDFPHLFPETIPVTEARADLRWWLEGEGHYRLDVDDIALENPDARAEGALSLAGRPGEPPWMRLRAEAWDGDASRTARYLPLRHLPPAAREWVAAAVIGGEVTEARVHWDGPLSGERFRQGEVAFQAGGRVIDGELAYQPDWPRLTGAEAELDFRGRSMHIRGHGGRLAGTSVQRVEVTLADLFEPVLAVQGEVHGSGEAYLDYLRQMPLTARLLNDVVPMALDGDHDLTLALAIPLRNFDPNRVRLDGRLQLGEGANYRLPRWDLAFNNVVGEVHFDERGLRISDLQARYLGHPLRVEAETDEQRIRLRGRTRGAPGALFPQVGLPEGWLHGEPAWQAELQLPNFRPDQGPDDVRLRLSSALEELAVDLPEPLGKPAGEPRDLTLEARIDEDGLGPVRWRYHDTLNGVLALDPERGAVPRMAVRLGTEPASLPAERSWLVRGRVPPVAVDPWLDWLEQHTAATGQERPEWPEDLPPLGLDLHFERLDLGALALSGQRLVLAADAHPDWRLQLDGPIRGGVFWPLAPDAATPMRADLERVDLDLDLLTGDREERAAEPADGPEPLRPGRLPHMDLSIGQLVIDRRDLGRLDLRVTPEGDSARFESIRLDTPSFALQGDMAWHYRDGGHRTELKSRLQGERAGDILATLGYLPSVSRGRTEIDNDVAWDNLPHRFTLAEMEGAVSLRIDDGQIPDLSPGAGRLFGLLSVTTLPRRLALDFSDIFGRGFAFDSLRADLELVDGQAHIQRFDIDGPAAKLAIEGRIGLRDRDYDQTVQVTPRLGATMPLVGFIVGGPVGAAAGWLADRVAGDEVERATRYSYRVTGPWDDPKVERRGADRPDAGVPPAWAD
ncbi:YhdP family protein [Alkalilimnicola ehrlichii MLHE-1]|uniref:YhdP family protein n=1 Tax=Alkalilimnicola ehrlichii TaxID=351052 RepID=UPI0002EB7630|nr:YhdP family protein [Alkalilimnicola ehrlichii]